MPQWLFWIGIGLAGWMLFALLVAYAVGRLHRLLDPAPGRLDPEPEARRPLESLHQGEADEDEEEGAVPGAHESAYVRVLVVDDDPGLRLLLRTTLSSTDEFAVREAGSAEEAAALARSWQPAVVVLDVALPGSDGLELTRTVKRDPRFGSPTVILLTGGETSPAEASAAGADALLRKPFSPLDLISLIDRQLTSRPAEGSVSPEPVEQRQLLAYAHDLGRLLRLERGQRRLLQHAYRQTVAALAGALEARDPGTGTHALRVQRYALELTQVIDARLLDDPSLEYGYLLHDIGKIAIPDQILAKPGPLTPYERQLMRQHPRVGVAILDGLALLDGEGIRVVASHHERWDGSGYPHGLAEDEIPLGARIFAVADALDAITSDRPYRLARPWQDAIDELLGADGSQFDPRVISAFAIREPQLRHLHAQLTQTV